MIDGACQTFVSELGESLANGPLAQLAQWAADNQAELTGSSTTP